MSQVETLHVIRYINFVTLHAWKLSFKPELYLFLDDILLYVTYFFQMVIVQFLSDSAEGLFEAFYADSAKS